MNTNTINSKNVISGVNDLATKCPMAASMWSDKNDCSPSEVSAGNNKKAWFVYKTNNNQKRRILYV